MRRVELTVPALLTAAALVELRARTPGKDASRLGHRHSPFRLADRQETRLRDERRTGTPRRAVHRSRHALFTGQIPMRTIV
jgi:hypothetical protein